MRCERDHAPPSAQGPGVDPWTILEELDDGFVVLDETDTVQRCTSRAAAVLGLPAEDLVGQSGARAIARGQELGVVVERLDGAPRVLIARASSGGASAATFLVRAGDELAESLNLARTMTRVVDLAVPGLADGCVVSVIEGFDLWRAGGVAGDGRVEHWAETAAAHAAVPAVARARVSAAPELLADVSPEKLHELVPEGALWDPLRRPAPSTAMVLPLRARGASFGALVLLGRERRPFDRHDLALAGAFVRRAAVAIDNAVLYRNRSDVVQVLQRSLLPPRLPDVPHLEIGARYRPLVQTVDIGGDYYDVFQVADDGWMAAIGDVCGKGASAAAMTGLVRHTVRAAAMRIDEPSAVLRALNEAVRQEPESKMCTVALARATPSPAGVDLVVSVGGHPPPYILRRSGDVTELEVRGTLVGAVSEPALRDVTVHLDPGDSLVLYTDGVTEARTAGREFGAERLQACLRTLGGVHADTIAERVVQEVADFVLNVPTDDIAVLVLRADEVSGG